MQVVYARQSFPERWSSAIFLAGPTPRSPDVPSWRPEALRLLAAAGFDGVVFVPEDAAGEYRASYLDQVGWEEAALSLADVILFWVPRALETMPAFTTNVEFGIWASSGKAVLGYPPDAPKCRYLGWLAGRHRVPVRHTLSETVAATLALLGVGQPRQGGERQVPLLIWRTPSFQAWYAAQQAVGNRLEGARLLWSYTPRRARQPFAWILKVQVHIAAEDRVKSNEWVFARSDLSAVVLHGPVPPPAAGGWLQTEVALVREFRAPGRSGDGFVHELPGGSADEALPPQAVAIEEVQEETGLHLDPARLVPVGARQLAGTLSAHHGHAYRVLLTSAELDTLRSAARTGQTFGIADSSEQTTIELWRVAALLEDTRVDWATVGMVVAALVPRAG